MPGWSPFKEAYFHINIAPQHCIYLRFTIGDDHYQFKVLPFGIASAPRMFTKSMVVVVFYLHSKCVTISPYIDDWLIVVDSVALLRDHLTLTLDLLHSLGMQVNWEKSQLIPMQWIQFIGAFLDSVKTQAFLPQDQAQKLWQSINKMCSLRSSPAIRIQRLLGHMAAAISVVPYAKLHMRLLQLEFH